MPSEQLVFRAGTTVQRFSLTKIYGNNRIGRPRRHGPQQIGIAYETHPHTA